MGTRRSRHNRGRKPEYKEHGGIPKPNECGRCGAPCSGTQCNDCYRRRSAFLTSDAAKALRLEDVERLSEPMAYQVFKQIRWHETEGQPQCPDCDGTENYSITRADGERWRCKDCGRDYSATDNTPFRSRKVPYKSILATIAVIANSNGDVRSSKLAEITGYGKKSAFTAKEKLKDLRTAHVPQEFVLGKSRFFGDSWMATRCWWTQPEKEALAKFVKQNADITLAANALGRSPDSIKNYARELALGSYPENWSLYVRKPREIVVNLQFPYITKKRDEHADLLAVNALVPASLPSYVRADIVQEMMLAIFEGRITVDEIKANKDKRRWFVGQFYKNNYEMGGRAVSLSGLEDDERSYDEIASSIAAREWRDSQMNERRRAFDSISQTFVAPTQLDDVYHFQIRSEQRRSAEEGFVLDYEEAAAALNSINPKSGRHLKHDMGTHKNNRLWERYGIRPTKAAHDEIKSAIRGNRVRVTRREEDRNMAEGWVRCQGRNVRIAYNYVDGIVITILPPSDERFDLRESLRAEMGFI